MSGSRTGTTRHRERHALPSFPFELMIVVIVALILLLIILPSYLAFKSRAHSAAARANLRTAVPAVDAYYLLAGGSFVGLDQKWLQEFNPGLKLNDPGATPTKQTATTYCVSATVGGKTWYKAGPAAPISTVPC